MGELDSLNMEFGVCRLDIKTSPGQPGSLSGLLHILHRRRGSKFLFHACSPAIAESTHAATAAAKTVSAESLKRLLARPARCALASRPQLPSDWPALHAVLSGGQYKQGVVCLSRWTLAEAKVALV